MTDKLICRDEEALTSVQYPSLDQNPAAVYIASLSERSRRVQMNSLKTLVATLRNLSLDNVIEGDVLAFPWHQLRYQHTQALRARLQENYSVASVNRILAALRRVLKECWRLGYVDHETMAQAADVQNVSGETVPAGRDVSSGEINALVDACYHDSNEALGIRDMAIIGVLYATGMRRVELAGLTIDDYTPDESRLFIRQAKRNKQRYVYLDSGAQAALDDWLVLRGDTPGGLFLSVNKGGRIMRTSGTDGLRSITAQTVYDLLKRRAEQANVAGLSPHDLRRTFVGDMLDEGVDIATVQRIAGHASVNTTARYDRRPEEAKRKAAAKLHFPYRKRRKLME